MANVNKVFLLGRLTRDPEARTFQSGGKVVKFGFAVNNRRKNPQTGDWEDDPVFLDVSTFGKSDNKVLDIAEGLRKGQQLFLEGHLVLEQWQDKQSGQKRQKICVTADNLQFIEPRRDGAPSHAQPARSDGPVGGNMFSDQRNDDIPF